MPQQWYNIMPGPAGPAAARAPPRDQGAGRPGGLRPPLPDGPDPPGGVVRTPTSTSRARCWTSTRSGGRRPCSGPGGSSRCSTPRPRSSTSTRASARPGHTSRTPRCPRRTTTPRPASEADHGDRCRPVGLVACLRLRPVRSRVRGVAGRSASYRQKPYRKTMMEVWGATVHSEPVGPSPSTAGPCWPRNPDHPGSLGIAISEAVAEAAPHEDVRYALGSVLNHVLMHQTDHRRGGAPPDGDGRRDARRAGRLHRWRVELRRPLVPVPAREARRAT